MFGPEHLDGEAGLLRTSFDASYALSRVAAGSTSGHVLETMQVVAVVRAVTDPSADSAADREVRTGVVFAR